MATDATVSAEAGHARAPAATDLREVLNAIRGHSAFGLDPWSASDVDFSVADFTGEPVALAPA